MYKHLGEKKAGYGIHCINDKQQKQLSRLVDNLNQGIYPAGTDIQSIYEFEFTVDGKKLMPFDWVDYRGGALSAVSDSDPELNELVSQINSCDALIVFLDGAKMTSNSWETECEYNAILSCIDQALNKSRKSWLPISFVITKADTISRTVKLVGLNYFSTFFEMASNSDIVHAMLCKCAVTNQKCVSTLLPLLFSIFGGTPSYIDKCSKDEAWNWKAYQSQTPTSFLGKLYAKAEEYLERVASNIDYKLSWTTTNERVQWAQNSWYEKYQTLKRLEQEAKNMEIELSNYEKLNLINVYGK
jgi:hypothetical protein